MTTSYFVTGTDTGVGKTLISCALLLALRKQHAKVVGMKPVAAGADLVDGAWLNDDVAALRAAGNLPVPPELDNPYCFPDPLSPHLAAARVGATVETGVLAERYRQLATLADAVVVEGAGGFIVPLSDTATSADFAVKLGLPMVVVVGLRLGCLNHAALTREAILSRGLTVAGWVANRVDPAMLAADDNLATLTRLFGAPPLADVPFMAAPDPAKVALRLP